MTTPSLPPDLPSNPPSRPGISALKTGLLVAASAFLGGLAVVFWNRQSLSRLRQSEVEHHRATAEEDAETE